MAAENPSDIEPLECYCIGGIHDFLTQSRGKVGRVMNVFERTVNVRTIQDELLVITLDKTRSPANLNVRSWQELRRGFSGLVREGQDIVVDRVGELTVLHAGGLSAYIDNPDFFYCSLKEPVAGFLHTFAAEVDSISSALVVGAAKREGCLLNPDMTTEGLLAALFERLEMPYARDYQDAMADTLVGLCGRGPGFTPAGDDFVAGYLAAYNWLGRALRQWPPIIPDKEFLRLTTWTSFKLMEFSARGLLDEQAQLMFNSVASGDVSEFMRHAELVGRRGHTSGIDFVTGATVGMCATSDWTFETDVLNRISSILVRKPAQLS